MIDKATIQRMKDNGEWIVSLSTWKKWQENKTAIQIGKTSIALGYVPVFKVHNKLVRTDWLLTYLHDQYMHLIPVVEKDVI
jgi:hypothetical protein